MWRSPGSLLAVRLCYSAIPLRVQDEDLLKSIAVRQAKLQEMQRSCGSSPKKLPAALDMRGKVVEHDAEELVHYDARSGGPGWKQPCPIPRLAELFEKCDFEHWQLEVKSASPKPISP